LINNLNASLTDSLSLKTSATSGAAAYLFYLGVKAWRTKSNAEKFKTMSVKTYIPHIKANNLKIKIMHG